MTAEQQLERSVLEGKERDELHAIAQALSVKTNTRTKKADMIDGILKATGVSVDDTTPAGGSRQGNGDGSDGASANGRRPARSEPCVGQPRPPTMPTGLTEDGASADVRASDGVRRAARRPSARPPPAAAQSFGPADDAEQRRRIGRPRRGLPEPGSGDNGTDRGGSTATGERQRRLDDRYRRWQRRASRPATEADRARPAVATTRTTRTIRTTRTTDEPEQPQQPGQPGNRNQGNRNNQGNRTRAAATTTWATAGATAGAGVATARAAGARATCRVPAGRSSSTRGS